MLIAKKSIVKDRVKPTAYVACRPTEVPAGDRAFEAVLHEIVGAVTVAAQQGTSESAQAWNVRFDQRGLISHCGTVGTTPNNRPASGIGRQNLGRGRHHRQS